MGYFINLFIICFVSLLVFVYFLNIKVDIYLKKKISVNVNNIL